MSWNLSSSWVMLVFSFSWRNSNSLIRVISGLWLAIYKSAIYFWDGGISVHIGGGIRSYFRVQDNV